ncbi:hypothetical protein [Flavobacterium orientale]|uniref:Uncharacterized protein n=1 Tax=Flavobacterium orientale TaxID=1756020 RepID=A0A916XWU0_9FLAO|nr:hypothetical protein [Flavobacterium orientale]GGD17585.1 hypothetical protein GCM10011343_05360 [Flavobacterium orientale]
MARQKGIIKLSGTIGGINFYETKDGSFAREEGGGFNSEAIKTKDSMAPVRENASEFAQVSRVGSLFCRGLLPFLQTCKDTKRYRRMVSLLQEIKTLDAVSERGKRTTTLGLATPMGKKLWWEFDLTERSPEDLLPGTYQVAAGSTGLTVSDLDLSRLVFPKGATLVELRYGVLDVDFTALTFQLHMAAPLFLDKDFADSSVSLALDGGIVMTGTLFPVVGVRFYQVVGGEKYLFKEAIWQGVRFMGE